MLKGNLHGRGVSPSGGYIIAAYCLFARTKYVSYVTVQATLLTHMSVFGRDMIIYTPQIHFWLGVSIKIRGGKQELKYII